MKALLHTMPRPPWVLAEPRDIRSMAGRLIVHYDRRHNLPWLVQRYINEDRGTEIVSSHSTEQEAERAVREAMFPPPPKALGEIE